MSVIKKVMPALLPFITWLIMIFYHGIVVKPFSDFMLSFSSPSYLGIILHILIQLLIICTLTTLAVKKFGYNLRGLLFSIPIMYLLFAIFSPPSTYLFVFTGGWLAFGQPHPAMPSLEASIYITLQYGVVMLIATADAYNKYG